MSKCMLYICLLLPMCVSAKNLNDKNIEVSPSKNCSWVNSNVDDDDDGEGRVLKCREGEKCLDLSESANVCEGYVVCQGFMSEEDGKVHHHGPVFSKKMRITCSKKDNSSCDAQKCFDDRYFTK